MAIKHRLHRIEQKFQLNGIGYRPITLFVIYGPGNPTEEQKRTAWIEYKANNPDYLDKDFNVVYIPAGVQVGGHCQWH